MLALGSRPFRVTIRKVFSYKYYLVFVTAFLLMFFAIQAVRSFVDTQTLFPSLRSLYKADWNSQAVTVVTAFVDIGDYQKGLSETRKVSHYMEWMKIWQKVKNGVVFYTHDPKYESLFLKVRAINGLPTKTVLVNIDDYSNRTSDQSGSLWSVDAVPNITRIFKRPGYPQHWPNTVLPAYSMVMNLKYDVLENAILSNPFHTSYFAWIDLGLYRDDRMNGSCFRIVSPPRYNQSKVAMNQVEKFRPKLSASDIVTRNDVWVGGSPIFGHMHVLLKFIKQYRDTAERMIQLGWYSTDQQTVYSMYADRSLNVDLQVDLQCFEDDGKPIAYYNANRWWYLGYLMRRDARC